MNRRIAWIAGAGIAIAILGGSAAVVGDSGSDDAAVTDPALGRATASALEHTAGTVTETEVDDEGAAYGVKVRRTDRSEVEITLDKNFSVIGEESDDSDRGDRDDDGAGDRDDD